MSMIGRTGPFLFPVGPSDPYFDYVSLLLHGDGPNGSTVFTDYSPRTKTVTPIANAKISTTASLFGGSSMQFDGNTDRLEIAHHVDFNLDADYTIEVAGRLSGVSLGTCMISKGWSTVIPPYLLYANSSNTKLSFYSSSNGSSYDILSNFTVRNAPSTNVFYRLAICRQGNDYSFYADGIRTATGTSSLTPVSNTEPLYIGGDPTTANATFLGFLEELRITKGIARYSGASYTIDNFAFPDR